MSVNKIQINLSVISATTATTINVPISMDYQLVDQSDIIKSVFVDTETKNAINPIIDFEKVRCTPIDLSNNILNKIIYLVDIDGATNYADIGFTDEDIRYEKEVFKQTFLNLNFYDSDNPLNQNLISNITIYSELKPSDIIPPGIPKPANQIPIMYVLENPITNIRGFSEGFYLYHYKDEIKLNQNKYLYMRASFKNAKDGTSTNMMVKNYPLDIDDLVHEVYTRYILIKTQNGYFYSIDNSYQGNSGITGTNNVTYSTNPNSNYVSINLFKIKSI